MSIRSDAKITYLKVDLTHTNYYITDKEFTFYCDIDDASKVPNYAKIKLNFSNGKKLDFGNVVPNSGATTSKSNYTINIPNNEISNIIGSTLQSVTFQIVAVVLNVEHITDSQTFYFNPSSTEESPALSMNGTFNQDLKIINYHDFTRNINVQPHDKEHNPVDKYYKYIACTWEEPEDLTILGIDCPISTYKFKLSFKFQDSTISKTLILRQKEDGRRIDDNINIYYDFDPDNKTIIFYDYDYQGGIPDKPPRLMDSLKFTIYFNFFSEYENVDDDTRQSPGYWCERIEELSSLLKEIDDISFDNYIRPNQNFDSEDFKEELQLKLPFKETMNYPNAGNRLYGILQNFVLQCIYKSEQLDKDNDIQITKNNFSAFWSQNDFIYGFNLKIPHRQLINNIYEAYQKAQGEEWSSEYNNNKTWCDDISFKITVEDVYGRNITWSEKQVIKSILLKEKPYWKTNDKFPDIIIYSADNKIAYENIDILNKDEYLKFCIGEIVDPNGCTIDYRFYYGFSNRQLKNETSESILELINDSNKEPITLSKGEIEERYHPTFSHDKTQYVYFYCVPFVETDQNQLDSSLFQAEISPCLKPIRIGRLSTPTLDLCTTDLQGITYRFSDNGGDQNLEIDKDYEDYLTTTSFNLDDETIVNIKYGGTNLTRLGTEYLELALSNEEGKEIKFSSNGTSFSIKRKIGFINNDEEDDIAFIQIDSLEEARKMFLEKQKNTFSLGLEDLEKDAIQNFLNGSNKIYVRCRLYYSTDQPDIPSFDFGLNSVPGSGEPSEEEESIPSGCIQFIHELTIKILGPTVGYRKNGLIINPATGGQDQLKNDEILKINLTSTRKNINIYDNDDELCVSIYRDDEGKFHLKGAIIDELEERIAALEAHHS